MDSIPQINFASLEKELVPFFKKPIILDTGPLVFLLIGVCGPEGKSKNEIWQGHTFKELDLLLRLVRNFKSIVITPQILAECTNLLKRDREPNRYQRILAQIINQLKECSEVYIEKNILLSYREFCRFGSTDIGIIECSKRMNYLIITEDSDLERFCHLNKIPCLNFNKLRPSTWN